MKLHGNDNPGFFDSTLSPGQLMLITAPMRWGKSNGASWLMEKGVPLGYDFYTNLLFFEYNEIEEAIQEGILKQEKEYYRRMPPEIHTITTASELICSLYETRKNITVLDEAIFFAGTKRGTSKDLRWFEEFVTQIGKLDSSIILIAQVKSKLATMLKEDLPTYELKIIKLRSGERKIEVWFNEPGTDEDECCHKRDTWRDIPPSRYPFDTKAPAGFEFDINMEHFINKISKLNSLKVRKEIPRILEELLAEGKKQMYKQPDKENKKDMILDIMQKNVSFSNKEILKAMKARGMPCTMSYLTTVKRELAVPD
ncbi:MAG: hypothetical protein IMZ64_08465 [Bacteroidetes bacterium]|nr:hypothetical protein [Bacteroidota bacterium]